MHNFNYIYFSFYFVLQRDKNSAYFISFFIDFHKKETLILCSQMIEMNPRTYRFGLLLASITKNARSYVIRPHQATERDSIQCQIPSCLHSLFVFRLYYMRQGIPFWGNCMNILVVLILVIWLLLASNTSDLGFCLPQSKECALLRDSSP